MPAATSAIIEINAQRCDDARHRLSRRVRRLKVTVKRRGIELHRDRAVY